MKLSSRQSLAKLLREIRDHYPTTGSGGPGEVYRKLVCFCSEREIPVRVFLGLTRKKRVADSRREFSRMMHDQGYSTPVIGRATNRDHTTILHHLRTA